MIKTIHICEICGEEEIRYVNKIRKNPSKYCDRCKCKIETARRGVARQNNLEEHRERQRARRLKEKLT